MPEFKDPLEPITVNTDGDNGDFIIEIGRKKLTLSSQQAKCLSRQIGYAVEFVELYARGPR